MNKVRSSFENDMMRLLNEYLSGVKSSNGILEIAQELINILMKKERELNLERMEDNKGNGYYDRRLACGLGNLLLRVPRDRNGDFRPLILPEPYKKGEKGFDDFVLNLVLHSYSPNMIRSLLHSLNLPYSYEQVEALKEELYNRARDIVNKELRGDYFAMFIDGYVVDIRDEETGRVKKHVVYSVIGINMEGRKEVLGYYIICGNEKKEDWIVIFNNLISRGLKRVLIIVSDDFPGLDEAVNTLFPLSDHQLCTVHLMKNIRRNMTKDDYKDFINKLKSIFLLNDYDKAVASFETLCEDYSKKYSFFIKNLSKKKYNYFMFLKYPQQIRKHIYTTNISENLNSKLEIIRLNAGGYFQSVKSADISIYVAINKLLNSKWKKPLPAFINCQYEINQLFYLKFNSQTQNSG